MLIRFSERTTGVKFKVTPYGLNSRPMVQVLWPPARGVSQLCDFGIGISPPAVKVAASPEIATRVGSASTRDTPARSKACRVAAALQLPRRAEAVSWLLSASTWFESG